MCSLESTILYKLHFLNKEINSKFSECTGISPSRLELLQLLYQGDELSQQDLQKELNIDNAAITRHLQQLEANEMITRRKKESDNRVTLVKLTNYGRQKIDTFEEEKKRFVNTMLEDVQAEERKLLLDLLNRMQNNIQHILM
ncbi:DNA-binding transcriptional regulator, MarR family [Fontibacillus panacisegetis]|uniref:DNA-binding transcriptional regulator, MarR family n=1 Tax=Fontibacillus panacisegetis TaxID=670482 RepID=A0A1G7MFH3_9BACL|nr:MarR family transcriptional regulator [Fontibacillus panacisegetis]SDF60354.1 DNA-binding transcriptional regulator, MarR family [Fontibacillus panacisegetis]